MSFSLFAGSCVTRIHGSDKVCLRVGRTSVQLLMVAGSAGFVAAAARNLPTSDVWCILYPSIRTLLHSDVLELDEESIMAAIITPVSCNLGSLF